MKMIINHPFLFNTIVVIFIASTSGWLVFMFNSRRVHQMEEKIAQLEAEKARAHKQVLQLKEQMETHYTHAGRATVISLSPPNLVNQAK